MALYSELDPIFYPVGGGKEISADITVAGNHYRVNARVRRLFDDSATLLRFEKSKIPVVLVEDVEYEISLPERRALAKLYRDFKNDPPLEGILAQFWLLRFTT